MRDDDLSGSSLEFPSSNDAGYEPAFCFLTICSKGCAPGCNPGCWSNPSCKSCIRTCSSGCDATAGLPNGYGTMLGKEFRDGRDLSLGEWQRVCLARLFMRNAQVMVYDEPSASLDIETESELLREISLSGKDRICILISHRMLRADIADRIVVIEKGNIVEQGSHDELVSIGGRYAHLWKIYHHLGGREELGDDVLYHGPQPGMDNLPKTRGT